MAKITLLVDGIEEYSEVFEGIAADHEKIKAERDQLLVENEQLKLEVAKLKQGMQDLDDAIDALNQQSDDLLEEINDETDLPSDAIVLTPQDTVQDYLKSDALIYLREGRYAVQNLNYAGVSRCTVLPHPDNTEEVLFDGRSAVEWIWEEREGVATAAYSRYCRSYLLARRPA